MCGIGMIRSAITRMTYRRHTLVGISIAFETGPALRTMVGTLSLASTLMNENGMIRLTLPPGVMGTLGRSNNLRISDTGERSCFLYLAKI